MSTMFSNRAQSANPRSATNVQAANIEQRPITSMDTQQPQTNVFNRPAWATLEPSTPSRAIGSRRRPKTASTSSSASAQLSFEKILSDEMESLVRSLDRDDTVIVQVDCLASYRKLVEAVNKRQTSLDCKSLCTLQQRENRIIQRNACHDTRFRSLLDVLAPSHILKAKENNSNDTNRNNVSEHQLNDYHIKYQ